MREYEKNLQAMQLLSWEWVAKDFQDWETTICAGRPGKPVFPVTSVSFGDYGFTLTQLFLALPDLYNQLALLLDKIEEADGKPIFKASDLEPVRVALKKAVGEEPKHQRFANVGSKPCQRRMQATAPLMVIELQGAAKALKLAIENQATNHFQDEALDRINELLKSVGGKDST